MAKFIVTNDYTGKSFRFGVDCVGREPEDALVCVER